MINKEYINNKSGQSVLEYVLVFAAVVAVISIFLGNGGIFRANLQDSYERGIFYKKMAPP